MEELQVNHVKKIAAVGDLHVRNGDMGKWRECFEAVSEKSDVLLLCGDLTDTGGKKEAKILVKELEACSVPVIGVLGNHDYEAGQEKGIIDILKSNNVHILDGESIKLGNVGFAGVKGFCGGFDKYMMPMFGENLNKKFVKHVLDQALRLDRALAQLDKGNEDQDFRKIALLHYAPICATVQGEPKELFPFLGSSHLLQPLESRQVFAAFHGHAHHGTLEGRTAAGLKVYNVAKHNLLHNDYRLPFFVLNLGDQDT